MEGHLKVCKLLIGADAMIDVDDKLGVTEKQTTTLCA